MTAAEAIGRLNIDGKRCRIDEPGPSYNTPPGTYQPVAIGQLNDPSTIEFDRCYWGFLPSWQDIIGKSSKNMRIESADSTYWAKAFRKRRCVIPANWWYEWQPYSRPHKGKTPYAIRPAGSVDGFFFAGVWSVAKAIHERSEVSGRRTFAILTQPPAADIAHIHDRMPVALDDEGARSWLQAGHDTEALNQIIVDHSFRDYRGYPVHFRVNNVKNNDASVLDPVNPA